MKVLIEMLQQTAYDFKVQEVVKWVGQSQPKMDALVALMLGQQEALALRASWVVSHVGETVPQLAVPYLEQMVNLLQQRHLHNGMVRNTLRALQFAKLPESLHGLLMDSCFRYIEDPKEKPAIKANALTILHNLSKEYSEILPEIKAIVAARMETETVSFKARAKIFFE